MHILAPRIAGTPTLARFKSQAPLQPLKVLIVDNDPDDCQRIARLLPESEFESSFTTSYVEGMHEIAASIHDVYLVDYSFR